MTAATNSRDILKSQLDDDLYTLMIIDALTFEKFLASVTSCSVCVAVCVVVCVLQCVLRCSVCCSGH